MGELGEGKVIGHRRVLLKVLELFPKARLFTVGEEMLAMADALGMEPVESYLKSTDGKDDFYKHIQPGDLVFLKASRSTGMEKLEPEE